MLALAKARQRQDRRAVSYLIAMAVLVAGIGAISWFFRPVEPPRVALAAYDAVATPEKAIKLYARAAPENREPAPKLDGLDLWFQVPATQRSETIATGADGSAVLDWQAPKAKGERLEFVVRHQQLDEPKKVASDRGRVFVWPAHAKLLVVDVDYALADGTQSSGNTGSSAPALRLGSAATLQVLAGHYKIVYLSAAANEPTRYKKLRTWLQLGKVPEGPLLVPSVTTSLGDGNDDIRGQIRALRDRFPEPAVGVTGRSVEAQAYLDVGWRAVVVGEVKDLPPRATQLPRWADLPKEIGP
jgi:hypothetical protein